jgi:hypothetical protein
VTQDATQAKRGPGPEHRLLDVFIGKWINEGHTVATAEAPGAKILTSDIYEWTAGGYFVLHTAYGLAGGVDGGGVEIISYDAEHKKYVSHFFDSQGNISVHDLTYQDGVWTWLGKWAGDWHRCRAEFSEDGKVQTAHHERSDDGVHWVPSMEVKLVKCA